LSVGQLPDLVGVEVDLAANPDDYLHAIFWRKRAVSSGANYKFWQLHFNQGIVPKVLSTNNFTLTLWAWL
jgi:hypothetical protein